MNADINKKLAAERAEAKRQESERVAQAERETAEYRERVNEEARSFFGDLLAEETAYTPNIPEPDEWSKIFREMNRRK